MSSGIEQDEDRFRRVYADDFDSLLAYALRRVAHAEDAADVVAETFLVAWRRRQDIPIAGATRLWLYGVARRCWPIITVVVFAGSASVSDYASRLPRRWPIRGVRCRSVLPFGRRWRVWPRWTGRC